MNEKAIWIANDHGGFALKQILCAFLREAGIPYRDIGCDSEDIVRYPYYAARVASAVRDGQADRGILICSTGIGMSIIANRFAGVRASLCTTPYMGRMTREHNDSNLLCLGGKITPPDVALEILQTWLDTCYIGGRHDISLGLIADAEAVLCTSAHWEPEEIAAVDEVL